MKMTTKAWVVSGKPREGDDMRWRWRMSGRCGPKKPWPRGEAGSSSIRYCGESRKGWKVTGRPKRRSA